MNRKTGKITDTIYFKLKEMIYSGQLLPNETLNLTKLAKTFKTSLTPVSSALSKLADEGLVISQPNKSCIVASMSIEKITTLFTTGMLMEGMAAYLAFSHITSKEIRNMQKLIEKMKTLKMPEEATTLKEINEEFHSTFIRCCNNKDIRIFIKENSWKLYRYYFLVLSFTGALSDFIREHQVIVDSFENGNAETVRTAVENHICDAGKKVLQLLKMGIIK